MFDFIKNINFDGVKNFLKSDGFVCSACIGGIVAFVGFIVCLKDASDANDAKKFANSLSDEQLEKFVNMIDFYSNVVKDDNDINYTKYNVYVKELKDRKKF